MWALIQSDWCPYKKRLRHTDTRDEYEQRKDHVRTCKKALSASIGEKPQEKSSLLAP